MGAAWQGNGMGAAWQGNGMGAAWQGNGIGAAREQHGMCELTLMVTVKRHMDATTNMIFLYPFRSYVGRRPTL
jgi:hypothetical protein